VKLQYHAKSKVTDVVFVNEIVLEQYISPLEEALNKPASVNALDDVLGSFFP